MSEVKRYDLGFRPNNEVKMCESMHGRWVFFDDFESERLAHEETKAELVKYQDAFVRERERFEHEEHDHSLTEKRLEELEVAILNAQNADSYDFLMNLQDKIAKARSKS